MNFNALNVFKYFHGLGRADRDQNVVRGAGEHVRTEPHAHERRERDHGALVTVDIVELAQRMGLEGDAIKKLEAGAEEATGVETFSVWQADEAISRRGRFRQMIEHIAKQLGVDAHELMRHIRGKMPENAQARPSEARPIGPPKPVETPQVQDESVGDAPSDEPGLNTGETDGVQPPIVDAGGGGASEQGGEQPEVDQPAPAPPTMGGTASTGTGSNGNANPSSTSDVADMQAVNFTGQTIVLDDQWNQLVAGIALNGVSTGVLVNNGQTSRDVLVNGFKAINVSQYGMYLGDVSNWTITNATLTQAAGASQHGLRIARGDHIRISNTLIDTTQGSKSSMWLIEVDDALLQGLTVKGGAIRIGARPNDNQGSPTPTNIEIRDSKIIKSGGGDAEAIQVWPGSNEIHLANLDITLTTSSNWLSIDSRNTANITWENVRVNGQLVTGFEGVNLGGMTEEEAIARGIHAS